MKTYPVAYRHRVAQLTANGYSTSAIAVALGVNAAWVRSIKALHRSGRPLEPTSKANPRLSLAEREGAGSAPAWPRSRGRRSTTSAATSA